MDSVISKVALKIRGTSGSACPFSFAMIAAKRDRTSASLYGDTRERGGHQLMSERRNVQVSKQSVEAPKLSSWQHTYKPRKLSINLLRTDRTYEVRPLLVTVSQGCGVWQRCRVTVRSTPTIPTDQLTVQRPRVHFWVTESVFASGVFSMHKPLYSLPLGTPHGIQYITRTIEF